LKIAAFACSAALLGLMSITPANALPLSAATHGATTQQDVQQINHKPGRKRRGAGIVIPSVQPIGQRVGASLSDRFGSAPKRSTLDFDIAIAPEHWFPALSFALCAFRQRHQARWRSLRVERLGAFVENLEILLILVDPAALASRRFSNNAQRLEMLQGFSHRGA
jgi:hypothetical protein